MATVAQKLITAEEFAQMPDPDDGSQQELVCGEIVTMPPPSILHGICCSKIDRRVGGFIDEHRLGYLCVNDSGVITERDPDTVRGIDIAFWSYARMPQIPTLYSEIAPDLAVEVLSPSNRAGKMRQKLVEYFAKDTRMVWIVDPVDRTVTVYRSPDDGQLLHETALLSGDDVLPGFSCPVADLFP